jgi:hypothetical protein
MHEQYDSSAVLALFCAITFKTMTGLQEKRTGHEMYPSLLYNICLKHFSLW